MFAGVLKLTAVILGMLSAAGGVGSVHGRVNDPASTGRSSVLRASSGEGNACKVGSSATLHVANEKSPQIILACGARDGVGRYELVGFNAAAGYCFRVDVIAPGNSEGGICKPTSLPWSAFTNKLKINGVDAIEGNSYSYTELDGEIPQVASKVSIVVRTQGHARRARATIAAVSGKLMKRLGQTEPFKLFTGVLPGCVPSSDLRIVAENAAGGVVGSVSGNQVRRYHC